jgi:hypothetical protein
MEPRHELDPIGPVPNGLGGLETPSRVVIGWDYFFGHFFVQVWFTSEPSPYGNPHLHFSSDPHSASDPTTAIEHARGYARIPHDLAATLRSEADRIGVYTAKIPNGVTAADENGSISHAAADDCPF